MDVSTLTAREIERLANNIGPGEWAVETDYPISTLLGSCVAVCLFDTGARVGGMNHFMLPQMSRGKNDDDDILLAGDACMEALLNDMLAAGAARHRIKAKAFGGGAVIDCKLPSGLTIGERNADFTREWLDREGIPLLACDFLGTWARKVLFLPHNGDVYCKRMVTSATTAQALIREEDAYAASLLKKPSATEKRIELF